jgi:hypothetical protein
MKETPPCELTDAELAWLWPRFQRCTFPVASFPKRFARNDVAKLREKGRAMAVALAFQYRRQIFGQKAAKWDRGHFISAVRVHAAPSGESPPLFQLD